MFIHQTYIFLLTFHFLFHPSSKTRFDVSLQMPLELPGNLTLGRPSRIKDDDPIRLDQSSYVKHRYQDTRSPRQDQRDQIRRQRVKLSQIPRLGWGSTPLRFHRSDPFVTHIKVMLPTELCFLISPFFGSPVTDLLRKNSIMRLTTQTKLAGLVHQALQISLLSLLAFSLDGMAVVRCRITGARASIGRARSWWNVWYLTTVRYGWVRVCVE
jgi:hypothetical protein